MLIRLFLLFLLIPQIIFGADWFVDWTNGNDANNCTNGTTELCKSLQVGCVDKMTGGDTCYIANTSAQILSTEINWTSFTIDNTKRTTFQSWDNGGSITIQRPDEASARVGAIIDGNSAVDQFFATTGFPDNILFKNIKFTGSNSFGLRIYSQDSVVDGCEFTGNAGTSIRTENRFVTIVNNYFHGDITSYHFTTATRQLVGYNYIDGTAATPTNSLAELTGGYVSFIGNKIILDEASIPAIVVESEQNLVRNNTFIGTAKASQVGLEVSSGSSVNQVYNNLFYNFDGTSAVPMHISSATFALLGYNAFYDCNSYTAPSLITLDLTSNDISGSGDPFVDSANDDYCVTGSTAEDAAYPAGSLLDIGALECTASGGGGNTYIFAVD